MVSISCNKISFQDLKKGMRARVKCARGNSPCCLRLQEMGLTEGTEFTVLKVAPFGDPVEIDYRGNRLCLRKCEVCGFDLELLE